MFPPGRARLATNPLPTGSGSCVMTMGIVAVAALAARVGVGPGVTITSTFRRTNSAASAGRRSSFSSAARHSMTMFFPSTYPSSRSPWRNASMRYGFAERGKERRKPIRATFFGCCASAGKESTRSVAHRTKPKMVFLIAFLTPYVSPNHLISPRQNVRRNHQTDLLSRLEINHQLELCRLFHRKIGGLSSLQNPVHVIRDAPVAVCEVRTV